MVTEECEVNHRPLYGQDVAKLHRSHIHEVGTGKKKSSKIDYQRPPKTLLLALIIFREQRQ